MVYMLGFTQMKEANGDCSVIFDVTHSLQCRDPSGNASGGRQRQVLELSRAGMRRRSGWTFLEAHPNPDYVRCDGPSTLPLELLGPVLNKSRESMKWSKKCQTWRSANQELLTLAR